MKNLRRRVVPLLALLVLLCGVMTVNAFAADDPTEEIGTKMIECPDCGAVGVVLTDEGTAAACESCGGTGYVESSSRFFNTFWSLLPPIIAIALALITKEVYSSLFIGIAEKQAGRPALPDGLLMILAWISPAPRCTCRLSGRCGSGSS